MRYTVNQKPQIKGAPNTEIKWDETLPVQGQVLDDGRGDPAMGEVTVHWFVSAGPGGAQVDNPASLVTLVHFTQNGIYTLSIEVSNGFVSSKADTRIAVNQPPLISAGKDQSVRPGKVSLSGHIVDNGLGDPSQSNLTFHWTQVSGPQEVKFSDADDCDTQVSLNRIGTYIFQFEARYGELFATDQVSVEARGNTAVGDIAVD